MRDVSIEFVNEPDDAETALLPALIWINASHPSIAEEGVRGFVIAIAWLHYAIAFRYLYTT